MLTIVVVGAGDVGCYIASLLSKEQHNVILIDKDKTRLENIGRELDVGIRWGSGTDWQLLDDLLEMTPSLLIALTDNDETNLIACCVAKHLGYPRTIARVRDDHFLNRMRLDFGRIFEVDYFIGPELLVAHEILKYMISPGSLLVESFAHGAVQLRTLLIPDRWNKGMVPLRDLTLPPGVIVGLIRRGGSTVGPSTSATAEEQQVIFPHGNDYILPDDEVTIIGETSSVADVHHFFGITPQTVRSLVIIGGSLTALNLCKLLEYRPVDVRLIEKDYARCVQLADLLPHCSILHHDATDLDFLKSEKVNASELVVSCTNSDEINILTAMLAKEAGCPNANIILQNSSFTPLLRRLDIDYAVSPRIIAANHIMAQLFSGSITSLVSLYDNQAEILEINVSSDSQIVGIPLRDLGPLLPQDLLIAMIQNRGRIIIAHGNRIISPGDTVIVITHPRHVPELPEIF